MSSLPCQVTHLLGSQPWGWSHYLKLAFKNLTCSCRLGEEFPCRVDTWLPGGQAWFNVLNLEYGILLDFNSGINVIVSWQFSAQRMKIPPSLKWVVVFLFDKETGGISPDVLPLILAAAGLYVVPGGGAYFPAICFRVGVSHIVYLFSCISGFVFCWDVCWWLWAARTLLISDCLSALTLSVHQLQ